MCGKSVDDCTRPEHTQIANPSSRVDKALDSVAPTIPSFLRAVETTQDTSHTDTPRQGSSSQVRQGSSSHLAHEPDADRELSKEAGDDGQRRQAGPEERGGGAGGGDARGVQEEEDDDIVGILSCLPSTAPRITQTLGERGGRGREGKGSPLPLPPSLYLSLSLSSARSLSENGWCNADDAGHGSANECTDGGVANKDIAACEYVQGFKAARDADRLRLLQRSLHYTLRCRVCAHAFTASACEKQMCIASGTHHCHAYTWQLLT
jgi:hypothetical protein